MESYLNPLKLPIFSFSVSVISNFFLLLNCPLIAAESIRFVLQASGGGRSQEPASLEKQMISTSSWVTLSSSSLGPTVWGLWCSTWQRNHECGTFPIVRPGKWPGNQGWFVLCFVAGRVGQSNKANAIMDICFASSRLWVWSCVQEGAGWEMTHFGISAAVSKQAHEKQSPHLGDNGEKWQEHLPAWRKDATFLFKICETLSPDVSNPNQTRTFLKKWEHKETNVHCSPPSDMGFQNHLWYESLD